jgi:hypothetical protein
VTVKDPFPLHAGLMAVVGLAGVAAAYWVPVPPEARLGAFLGVAIASLTGAVALPMKRRALGRSIEEALKVLGYVFAVRLVAVALGLWFVIAKGAGPIAFTAGFFGEYFTLQWIEISYLLAEQKRRGPGA